MDALGRLVRNTIAVLLLVVLGLLVALALRSLAVADAGDGDGDGATVEPAPSATSADGGDDDGSDGEQPPAGPQTSSSRIDGQAAEGAATVVFGDPETAASVSCFRSEDDPEGPFYVQLVDPGGAPERSAVAIALVGPSGEREQRTVELGEAAAGQPVTATVDDSDGTNRFARCAVTALQRDRQVFHTGN